MSFSKSKPRRGPLERLSDQRRSLALAGLAVGAVFSAAILRRRRRGEEIQFEPEAPVAQAESSSSPTVDASPPEREPTPASAPGPAREPEPGDAPRPINAAPVGSASAAGSASEPERATGQPAPLEPATGELSAEEASILAVLAQSGRGDDDRTAIAVAGSLGRDAGEVTVVLRKLGAEGVVAGEVPTSSGEEIWAVTERGVRRLGAQN